ncbi:hypothetical protein A1O1_02678 [Capronia coronata CBS 617.96]|uniref:Hemerythrin-like domain-containing protein n=1 Tax=Capronia coronata CBS 617.96 TaxID=1182541 RepID=W9ZIF1_9EURO|nr:uncharacterized protein A1O1_02678 [Capronia coronata CBS 617.96]EXJ94284.1 hypothetical protein A1O1_02678 [Capronia coronata CBS 617.96]
MLAIVSARINSSAIGKPTVLTRFVSQARGLTGWRSTLKTESISSGLSGDSQAGSSFKLVDSTGLEEFRSDFSISAAGASTSTSSSTSTHTPPQTQKYKKTLRQASASLAGFRGLESLAKSQIRQVGTMASMENCDKEVSSSGDNTATSPSTAPSAEPPLPKLSAAEFRTYNRLAVMMDAYHNHFRYTWNLLYKACTTGSRPAGMPIRTFISQGMHLCHALTVHHTIEEQHIFPELAERMPVFAPQELLISQHEQIHEGLEKLEEYLKACLSGEREMRLPELKEVMDSFGDVLWTHLDDEVRMLGAESMRKHWSKEEILSMHW